MPDFEYESKGRIDSPYGELLTPLQAAEHLGITVELLFAYTAGRTRAKRHLRSEDYGGKTRFKRTVLDEYHRYLGEPWAPEGERRPSVPRCIENHLRAESGNECTRCGSGKGVETAHIVAWEVSRSHHHHNLIRLCKSCHTEYDQHKSLSVADVRKIKNRAIARIREALRNRMNPIAARFRSPLPEGILEGRAEEINFLRDALRASRSVLIHGPGGIGKTQLLAHVLGMVETGRRVVWVEVEQVVSAKGILTALQVLLTNGTEPVTRDTLPNRLDALPACLVLDGVERLNGPAIDEVDDLLDELKNSTVHTQFVVTSQVNLQRTVFDYKQELAKLACEPSRKLLQSALRNGTPIDPDSERSLLKFADGHPLSLRLIAKLANFLGSGREASAQIAQKGAAIVEIQNRTTQDRGTSLKLCLALAYEMLSGDEQRILYLIASCPGGILTRQLEFDDHGGSEAPLLLAGLRRRSLVQTKAKGEWDERTRMLSPIRSYVKQRWSKEHTLEARTVAQTLVGCFATMAAAIEENTESAAEIPTMLSLYSQELPNLLLVVDEAEVQLGNSELSFFASLICRALMRFFFILRLPEQGSQLMERGAKIALRDGDAERASDHIVMMVSLAQRSDDWRVLPDAEAMLKQISTENAESNGNIALTYAMLANCRGDEQEAEQHSREAISHFEVVRDQLARRGNSEDDQAKREENSNDLSGSFQKLGDALLAQYRPIEARAAYEEALKLLRGGAIAVNEGQILHQIGNCLSQTGDNAAAADRYARAAACFHQVRMRDYLSNALAGWGFAVLELEDETSLPKTLSPAVLAAGLADVAQVVERCFPTVADLDQKACDMATSKLFGVVVASSFSEVAVRLEPTAQSLSSNMASLRAEVATAKNMHQADRYAWNQLEALLKLMSSIANFEANVTKRGHVREDDTTALAMSCAFQAMWSGRKVYALDWLDLYLRRKWSQSEKVPQGNGGP